MPSSTTVLGGRPPTVADLPRLTYTENIINETLRVYPTVWMVGREAIEPVELGGYVVPAGTTIFLPQWVIHRDGRWFDEPESFRPERWADGLMQRIHRYAYFPFGGGPRICIGNNFALMEAALILATIAQKYRLALAPDAEIVLLPTMTLRPARGVKVVVHEMVKLGVGRVALLDSLERGHVAVEAAAGHELAMAAGLDDGSVVEDNDMVGVTDRAQTMGDDE